MSVATAPDLISGKRQPATAVVNDDKIISVSMIFPEINHHI
jgi:hypothetical protein